MRMSPLVIALVAGLAACDGTLLGPNADPNAPANLSYHLVPSGDPNVPLGVLLTWDPPSSGRAVTFDVYGRDAGQDWVLRATTTSPTFYDAGVPQDQYYVVAMDQNGQELGQSQTVSIDTRNRLPAPLGLTSISLNGAIQLSWSANAYDASHGDFEAYRVYSAPLDASHGTCSTQWALEGTTVSDAFLAANLTNGATRCFAVSAVNGEGLESEWSEARQDTPRFDARSILVYATAARPDSSAFLFFDATANKVGVVGANSRTDADVVVQRNADGTLWLAPARTGVALAMYASKPVADLTSIDRAPTTGFASVALQAIPAYAYVFRIDKPDGAHYAAVRVAYVATDYVVFDWSYQSAVGNPELNRAP